MSGIKNEKILAEHETFIRNSVLDLSTKSYGKNHHNIAAHLIGSCIMFNEGQKEENEVNEKEMCPYCFNLWSNGQYTLKTKPKVKRKGKYKVTALEILCFQCNKTVKIHTSKVTRSQIIDNIQSREEKCLINNKKKINKISKPIESNQEQLKSLKKKVKEESSLITPNENPNSEKVIDSLGKKISFVSKAMKVSKTKTNQNNLAQKKNDDKKRLKFQKHLSKNNQTLMKPKSSLESFLNSVNNI